MIKITEKNKFQILNYRLSLEKTGKIFDKLESGGIEPVLIKGLAAAQNYPRPYQRIFGDIDLAVAPDKFESAGVIIERENSVVDLHKGLRHLDSLNWDKLFSDSLKIEIEGYSFRVLRAEDHLRVLSVHWLNDGGANRQRIWDIYFAVKNRPQDFDWSRFFDPVSDKRKKWLLTVLLICEAYTGLKTGFPDDKKKSVMLPEWIRSEIEKEWGSDVGLIPLDQKLSDLNGFIEQLKKRIPPNGLTSFIECEADLFSDGYNTTRLRGGIKRAFPSLKRIITELKT